MFVDAAKIYVKAGAGGRGCVSFCRERYRPLGGPDGGRGGNGGSVIFLGTSHLTTLTKLARKVHYRAEKGQGGAGKNRQGKSGKDLVIPVPLGTLVRDEKTGDLLGDVTEVGQKFVVAQGGKGGRGNKAFATSTHQAPREYGDGVEGEDRWLVLELKLMADVGLVGLPNAGKSTLLCRVTSARPKVADYPFTTLNPHLGIVDFQDFTSLVIADIPGLIEGAHQGQGLGIDFLKHIERTSVILHMIDATSPDALQNYWTIRRELENFSEDLAQKTEILAATKMDMPEGTEGLELLQNGLNREIFPISSLTGKGMEPLLYKLKTLVKNRVSQRDVEEKNKGENTNG